MTLNRSLVFGALSLASLVTGMIGCTAQPADPYEVVEVGEPGSTPEMTAADCKGKLTRACTKGGYAYYDTKTGACEIHCY